MPMNWNQDVKRAAKDLCGMTFTYFDKGAPYSGVITETRGWTAKEGPRRELFLEPPGTIVLWRCYGGHITNIAAHPYGKDGIIGIGEVQVGSERLGPNRFTEEFKLKEMNGYRITKTRGSGIYIAETPGLDAQGLCVTNVLDERKHPDNMVARWRLEKKLSLR